MVARKGVRKPRRRQNKRYARRNKVATLATVKRLITGTQETKCHYINPVEFTMGNNTAYVLAPLEGISKGTTRNQRVGESISHIKLRGVVACSWAGDNGVDAVLSQGGSVRVMLVRTDRVLSSSPSSSFGTVGITMGDNSAGLPMITNGNQLSYSFIDPASDIKILKQFWVKTFKYDNDLNNGVTAFKQFSFSIPRYHYDVTLSSPSVRGRHYNYYLVVASTAIGMSTGQSTAKLQSHFMVQFKDA